jgi:hypothetical protein
MNGRNDTGMLNDNKKKLLLIGFGVFDRIDRFVPF